MNNLAANHEVSTPSSNPQICNLLCAASGGEFGPERLKVPGSSIGEARRQKMADEARQ